MPLNEDTFETHLFTRIENSKAEIDAKIDDYIETQDEEIKNIEAKEEEFVTIKIGKNTPPTLEEVAERYKRANQLLKKKNDKLNYEKLRLEAENRF
jgi:DNA repair ATPase RecN